MYFNMFNVVVLFVLVSLCLCDATEIQNVGMWQVKTSADCPGRGYSTYGYWTVSDKEGTRCVLVCFTGYEPDNCHVLRKIGPDRWNMEIPQCVKEPWIRWKTVAKAGVAVAAGAGAVVAAPVVLGAAGFTSAGVAAGSIAAGLQGSATAAGGVFATLQSAGAAGLATGTQAGLFSGVSAVTGAVTSFFGGVTCEQE